MFWILFTCCALTVYITLYMAKRDTPEYVMFLIASVCAILEHVGRPLGEPRSVANLIFIVSLYKILEQGWHTWREYKTKIDAGTSEP